MKALVQGAPGEPADALRLVDVEDQRPGPGEVLIDIRLAPVHHGDLALIRSLPELPEGVGYVRRGSEAVGIVRALGSEAQDGIAVGDRVIVFPAAGAWAQSVAVPASAVVPVPPELGDEVAAQLLINYVTACMVMRGLRRSIPHSVLREGAVLVTGASTVVGRLLLHFLGKEGAKPVGLARSSASAKRVAAELAGVELASTDGKDWQAQVAAIAAGRKIVGVLDCISGSLVRDLVPLLSNDAAIVTYGALGGEKFGIGGFELVARQLVNRGVVFTRWFVELSRQEQATDIHSALQIAVELPSLFKVAGVYRLADFHEAMSAVEAPGRNGFVLIRP